MYAVSYLDHPVGAGMWALLSWFGILRQEDLLDDIMLGVCTCRKYVVMSIGAFICTDGSGFYLYCPSMGIAFLT